VPSTQMARTSRAYPPIRPDPSIAISSLHRKALGLPPDISMIDRLTQGLDFNAQALLLRSERTRVLASNIANADTPHYKARDFDFRAALSQATGVSMGGGAPAVQPTRTAPAHLAAGGAAGATGHAPLAYRTPLQSALDGNTVDMDMERAAFADNSVRYEASLRFLNGQIRTLMSAINGQ
jgi:flagellar basal-body rod protein FlgB